MLLQQSTLSGPNIGGRSGQLNAGEQAGTDGYCALRHTIAIHLIHKGSNCRRVNDVVSSVHKSLRAGVLPSRAPLVGKDRASAGRYCSPRRQRGSERDAPPCIRRHQKFTLAALTLLATA